MRAGASVAIVARRPEVLEESRRKLAKEGKGKVVAIAADVGKAEDCARVFATAEKELGRVDVLLNNAGTHNAKPVEVEPVQPTKLWQADRPTERRSRDPHLTAELARRWKAEASAMGRRIINALIIQGAKPGGTGGYFRWFTGVSMGTSYPATVIFPKDGLMTLVSHGPMGVERDFDGKDPVWRGVGKWLPTASFPAIDYCIPYDAELVAREIKKAGYRNVGIVGWNNMLFGFGDTLRKLLDGVTLSDATRLIDPLKAKKSAEEIELIRMARPDAGRDPRQGAERRSRPARRTSSCWPTAPMSATCSAARPATCWAPPRRPASRPRSAAAASRAARCATAT